MGQLHNELRRGSLSIALKTFIGDTRDPGGLERYGETLTPILDMWGLPEVAYLRRELLWAGQLTQTAVVGEQSMLAVTNPLASGKVVVVETISLQGSVQSVRITPTVLRTDIEATLAIGLVPQAKDQRWWRDPATVGFQARTQFWVGTNAGSLGGITTEKLGILAGEPTSAVTVPYVIRPGCSLLIEGMTVNLGVDFSIVGRERVAFPGELP